MISQLIDKVKLKDAYLPEWRQRMRRVVQSDAAALHHYHLSPPPRTPSISIIIITTYHMISEWRVWARRGQYSIVVTIAAINILFSGPTVDMSAISDVYCYEDDTRIQFKYSGTDGWAWPWSLRMLDEDPGCLDLWLQLRRAVDTSCWVCICSVESVETPTLYTHRQS